MTALLNVQLQRLQRTCLALPRMQTCKHELLRPFSIVSLHSPEAATASPTSSLSHSPSGSKRFRQHVNPLLRVYRQPVKLPEWTQCFANTSLPIHLDIGCARGKYLMDVAESRAKEWNFVGVEIRRNVLQEAKLKAKRRGLCNLDFVHANMNLHQTTMLQSLPGPVKSVSIFHPDPWMKKRHIKRRLVNEEFVGEMATNLPNGTPIYIQTDVKELFTYMIDIYKMSNLYTCEVLHENPLGIPTDREQSVNTGGGNIYRMKFTVNNLE